MPGPAQRKEAFSRVLIDKQLLNAGWKLDDGVSVRYEYRLPDDTFADYVLCDRHGRTDLLAATGISEANWTWTIRQIRGQGKVAQKGEKRGARYHLSEKRGKK